MRTDTMRKGIYMGIGLLSSLLLLPSCMADRQDILALNRQMRTLDNRVQALETIRERQAEITAEMDGIKQELRILAGSLEENDHLIKHIAERDTTEQDELKAGLAKLEAQLAALGNHIPTTVAEPQRPSEVSKDPGISPPALIGPDKPPPATETDVYESTLKKYREADYADAIGGFKQFLKAHPDSKLADNAQFWIGESYMALKKYNQAILAYQEVITKYPQGNKVPNAMLKQALAFNELNDTISSRLLLKKILKKYPESAEADLAEAKLKTIK